MKVQLTLLFCLLTMMLSARDTIFYNNAMKEVASMEEAQYYGFKEKDASDLTILIKRIYYKSGQIKSAERYSIFNNKHDEKSIEWYENGQLLNEIDYINGNYHGKLITFWENGQKRREDVFEKGEFIKGQIWDSLGNELSHCPYVTMPEYKGGMKGIYNTFSRNLRYPQLARGKYRRNSTGWIYSR